MWLFKSSRRALPLDYPRVIGHESKSLNFEINRLKKTGIIIPSPWGSGGYQSLFNPILMFPKTNFKQVLINNIKASIHDFSSLRKNDIMTPFPRSGCYQIFLNLLAPNPPDYRTVVTLLLVNVSIHLALFGSVSYSAIEPFSTSLCLPIMTIISSNTSSVDDSSTNLGI